MTKTAIPALQAESDRVTHLINGLDPAEWAGPSGCAGWRVQDVVAHMGAVFRSICGDSSIPSDPSGDAEKSAELAVAPRKEWSAAEVRDEYLEWAPKGIAALTALQDPPMATTVAPLGNLGSHPLHILANAIVFDHYCHLRHDIGAGVARAAALPRDGAALTATLEWMLMGLPQMCASALSTAPQQAVNFQFDGVPESEFVLAPGHEPDGVWTVVPGRVEGAPTCRTTAHDFVSWGTKRADWRASCQLGGAADTTEQAAGVLDAINII